MPRLCRVCEDPRLEAVDAALAGGESVPKIAAAFELPESNIYRHRTSHMTIARSITTSRPAGVAATVERLEAIDRNLPATYDIARRRSHTQAMVAAAAQRVKIAMEISGLRDEVKPKEKRVLNINLSGEEAQRIALSYMRHQELTGGTRDEEEER